ncbi:MAG TPA: MFS transporter [Candidatus Saccharimonadales bacterium]|nr:MFS transporter [Candidatus Saccharimonadales bacterium]
MSTISPVGKSTAAPSTSTYLWTVVALLWPVALLNYLDRQMLASMKFSVMQDIPSIGTEAHWGFLPASFKWVYAGLSPFGGYIADRFSRRWVIVGSLFVWSVVTWLTGHVHTFEHLVATRALMGVSEAFYIPAALALISEFHSSFTRSRAVGFHQTAIYMGVMVGGFSGYVAEDSALGWRLAFTVCGVVGIVYAIPLLFLLRDPIQHTGPIKERASSPLASVRELLGNRSFLLLVLYFTLPALAGWIVRDWMPAILKQRFGIGQGKAGVSATLYVNIATVFGGLAGGWLADRWMRRSARGRIFVSAIGMSLIIPALLGVGFGQTLGVAVAFLVMFGLGWGAFDSNNMPILCQIARPHLRATGYGLMNLISISCGGFADWGFGALRDRNVPLPIVFGLFAGAAAIALVLVLLIRPRNLETSSTVS